MKKKKINEAWKSAIPDDNWIARYEAGKMGRKEAIKGLQHIADKRGWRHLTGHYARAIKALVGSGEIKDTKLDFTEPEKPKLKKPGKKKK